MLPRKQQIKAKTNKKIPPSPPRSLLSVILFSCIETLCTQLFNWNGYFCSNNIDRHHPSPGVVSLPDGAILSPLVADQNQRTAYHHHEGLGGWGVLELFSPWSHLSIYYDQTVSMAFWADFIVQLSSSPFSSYPLLVPNCGFVWFRFFAHIYLLTRPRRWHSPPTLQTIESSKEPLRTLVAKSVSKAYKSKKVGLLSTHKNDSCHLHSSFLEIFLNRYYKTTILIFLFKVMAVHHQC